jgi:hypothetical protein
MRSAAITRATHGDPETVEAFHALGLQEKWRLVEDIVVTRRAELVRAYPDAIDVMAAQRRRRGRLSAAAEPCVKFLVEKKWRGRRTRRTDRHIPAVLLAALREGDHRRVYGVPTDVEEIGGRARVRPHGASVMVERATASEEGVLTCAVRRGSATFALGCRHVLSLSESFPTASPTGLAVTLAKPPGLQIGVTSGVEGLLRDADHGESFDAQLVEVTSNEALRLALGGLGVTRLASDEMPPHRFFVLTPDGLVGATFSGTVRHRPAYTLGPRWIQHDLLFEYQPDESLHPGDSGSPVVSEDGTVLLGMHVAGTTDHQPPLAYMIPAHHLLDPRRYTGADTTEAWTLA